MSPSKLRFRRTESRTLRPFVGVQSLLDGTELFHNEDGWTPFGGTHRLNEEAISTVQLKLPYMDFKAVEDQGYRLDDLNLIVVQSVYPLHQSEVIRRFPLNSVSNQELELDLNPPFSNYVTGFLELSIVLIRELDPAVAKAYRKGSWLAKIRMDFKTESNQRLFDIRYEEPSWFEHQGLSIQTSHLIRVSDGLRDIDANPSDIVEVVVNAEAARMLEKRSLARNGEFINMILTSVLTRVLTEGYKTDKEFPEEQTLLHSAITEVADGLSMDVHRLHGQVRNEGVDMIHALVQGSTRAIDAIRGANR